MKHYAGLDVSVKETADCIVDEGGRICRKLKVASHPGDLPNALKNAAWNLTRIGLEAGPLSQWLFNGVTASGLPVIYIETRHTQAFIKAQINKTDRKDARGIAQTMWVNLFRPVHVKTLTSQKSRSVLKRPHEGRPGLRLPGSLRYAGRRAWGCTCPWASRLAVASDRYDTDTPAFLSKSLFEKREDAA